MTRVSLDPFLAPVRQWFVEAFGEPTPPQAQGWPPIQRGEHTLILAPTGSGKTLAAFLWGLDQTYRVLSSRASEQAEAVPRRNSTKQRAASGKAQPSADIDAVQLLYVSPLKALNNDIERNLRVPLEGIREVAARFLGGQTGEDTMGAGNVLYPSGGLVPRPVSIVNAHYHKNLELSVVTAVEDFKTLEAGTIWPYIIPRVLQDIREHRTTLIF